MRWFHYALGALVLGGLGFAVGRFSTPDKVVTVEVEKVVTVEDSQSREKVRELTEQIEKLKADTHRETIIIERPDGTKETKITEDTHVERNTGTREETAADKEETKRVETVREVFKEKIVEKRPDWFLAPTVGIDVRTGAIHYGGMIQRRIVGPVSVGIWGLSNGTAGVSVGVSF